MGAKKHRQNLLNSLRDLRDRLREEEMVEAPKAADELESLIKEGESLGFGGTINTVNAGSNAGNIHQSGGSGIDPFDLPRAIAVELRRGSLSCEAAAGALATAIRTLSNLSSGPSVTNTVNLGGDNSGNIHQSGGTINVQGDWRA